MLSYGCGVSTYPQVFVEDLDIYQMLPHPYLISFDGGPVDKLIKENWVINLANRAETFVWECIESRIISDDRGNIYISQYWSNLKQKPENSKEILPPTCRIGRNFLLLWLQLVVNSTLTTPKT